MLILRRPLSHSPQFFERSAAALVALLGIAVMVGWFTHNQLLVRVLPAFAPMRFNTALTFFLTGTAMCVRRRSAITNGIFWLLVVAIAVIAGSTLAEYLLDRELVIDRLFFQSENPLDRGARMAPQTAGCFMVIALTLTAREIKFAWSRYLAIAMAWSVAITGATSLFGYSLGMEVLYSVYGFIAMAVHTAAGFLLLGIAIVVSLRRTYGIDEHLRSGARVNLTVLSAVIVVTLAAGSAGFVVMGKEQQNLAQQSLAEILRGDRALIELELAQRRDDLERIATRPILIAGLRVLNGETRDTNPAERLAAMLQNLQARPDVVRLSASNPQYQFVPKLLAMKVTSADGQHSTTTGTTAQPRLSIPLDEHITLLWDNTATLLLHTEVRDGDRRVGYLQLEYRFDMLDSLIADTATIGATADLRVCAALDANRMQCLPTRLAPEPEPSSQRKPDGKLLAMDYALSGKVGTTEYVNYRHANSLGSYAPVAGTQLGLVLMRDVADLYEPLRIRLYVLIVVITLIAAFSIAIVGLRVAPLVQGIESARRDAANTAMHLASIMQTAPNGILTLDAHGKIVSCNAAIAHLFGYETSELLQLNCELLLPGLTSGDLAAYSAWSEANRAQQSNIGFRQIASEKFDSAATGQHRIGQNADELVARHKHGHVFTVQMSLARIDQAGSSAFVGVVSDVTERVQARAKLNAAFDTLQSTVNCVAMGIAVFSAEHKLRIWNARFVTLSGVTATKLGPGTKLKDVLRLGLTFTPMEFNGAQVEALFLPHSATHRGEYRCSDGRIFEIAVQPMPDHGYVLTYNDVTALADAEFKYRDQATRLSTTLDSIVDAIITMNESGTIESWNKGAESVLGYRSGEVLGRNVNILMPQPHAGAHDGYLRRYLQTHEARVIGARRRVEALHKDGHHVPVSLSVSEMVIGGRRLFVGVLTDMTAQLEMERMKSGFVAAVSHELRTPLTSIAGSLGLLAGGVTGAIPDKAKRMIEIAKNNCDRLIRLINDILDIEKADSGKMEFKLEVQPLVPILERVVEAMQAYAATCGVRIELNTAGLTPTVMVDTDRLIQVMTNLLSNAAKFSPRDSIVQVEVALHEDAVRISVRDHGAGIPAQFHSRIFEKFAQADSSDARAVAGTGLGLAISKAIVERLSGSIGFDSQVGKGTSFHVDLPNYAPVEDHLVGMSSVLRNLAILICEDDRDVATMMETTLLREGAHPVVVRTIKDARTELTACKYDLLICDMHLPDGNGVALIQYVRLQFAIRLLPVIMVSASVRSQHAHEMLDTLRIADWIRKPIVPARLLRAVRKVLAQERPVVPSLLLVGDDSILSELLRTVLQGEVIVESVRSMSDAAAKSNVGNYRLLILIGGLDLAAERDLTRYVTSQGISAVPVISYAARSVSPAVASLVKLVVPHPNVAPDAIAQLLTAIKKYTGLEQPSPVSAVSS